MMALLPQIILFGDSITQGAHDQTRGFGFAAELQAAYVRRFDVINRGFSAYNTDHALEVLPRVIPTPEQANVKFFTIWLGANDANTNPQDNQYVPLPRFKSNLSKITSHPIIKSHSPHIILLTTPPFEETILEQFRDEEGHEGEVRKAKDAQKYAQAVIDVGKELGIPVVDVWGKFMEAAKWNGEGMLPGQKEGGKNDVLAELLFDGLHLSGAGYKIVYDALIEVIREKWPEYPPYKLPFAIKLPWEVALGDEFWDIK